MKSITMVTEKRINRMVKDGRPYGTTLLYLLNQMKCRVSCYGATVKEIKEIDKISLNNETQIDVFESSDIRALDYKYFDLINCVFCYDLHYVNIKDFNKLVKILFEKEYQSLTKQV